MSTATQTETDEVKALRQELDDANQRIIDLQREYEALKEDADGHECYAPDSAIEQVKLFADHANWQGNTWAPVMQYIERDPVTLANQILDDLRA